MVDQNILLLLGTGYLATPLIKCDVIFAPPLLFFSGGATVDLRSIPWPNQTKRLKKLVFTASLFDVQHFNRLVWR